MRPDQLVLVKNKLANYRMVFEKYLKETAPERKEGVPDELFKAMDYSLSSGGKRLRPALCMAAAERCGCHIRGALPLALGLEMFHTASLIHDDLPCMDDDDMRRGKLSNHKVFGEAIAVLAADSLMTEAFAYPLRAVKCCAPAKLLKAMTMFGREAGPSGVCGGQALDMNEERKRDPEYVSRIASLKTAALIRAAVACGAALGTDSEEILRGYSNYGTHLGLAFQIIDDILDVTGAMEELGKTIGKDAEQGKITHVTVFGLEKARDMAVSESFAARESLPENLAADDFLMLLPEYLVSRNN